jgi:predicted nucleic acid-binding protein
MLAIDTNVIVRYLTGDHPEQSQKAKALIDSQPVFLCTTALLEAEWVLRSAYGYSPIKVAEALGAFAGLPTVTLESPALAAKALDWTIQGMDFADALHLASASDCDALASFDRKFAKAARKLSGVEIREL